MLPGASSVGAVFGYAAALDPPVAEDDEEEPSELPPSGLRCRPTPVDDFGVPVDAEAVESSSWRACLP